MVYRFRPRFRLPLSDHSLKAMPYGYHLSAPLSAITFGFPLSAPLSVYRFQDHSPGATPFGYHLSAPLSAIAFSTVVGLPFGPAFSLPLSDHNFSAMPSDFTFRPRFRRPSFGYVILALKLSAFRFRSRFRISASGP
jgi:hypothetical protein